ncbi:hypothetical protein, partial [Mesorhizobium sp. M7A.F.Ca.ET.027.02.1.1]|uniref:hypothetical protein n=1 Tax=Mesorhizobium sp. M7A.F.Ca.ET.027.02.1.1 TaxID=2496655 RepID=UPI001AECE6D5
PLPACVTLTPMSCRHAKLKSARTGLLAPPAPSQARHPLILVQLLSMYLIVRPDARLSAWECIHCANAFHKEDRFPHWPNVKYSNVFVAWVGCVGSSDENVLGSPASPWAASVKYSDAASGANGSRAVITFACAFAAGVKRWSAQIFYRLAG